MEASPDNLRYYLEVRETSESLACDCCGRPVRANLTNVDVYNEKIHGLLCQACRQAVSRLRQLEPVRLEQALVYWRKHPDAR